MLLSPSPAHISGPSILLSNRCHMFFAYRKICRNFKMTVHLRLLAASKWRWALHFRHLYTIVNLFLRAGIALYATLKRILLLVIRSAFNSSDLISNICRLSPIVNWLSDHVNVILSSRKYLSLLSSCLFCWSVGRLYPSVKFDYSSATILEVSSAWAILHCRTIDLCGLWRRFLVNHEESTS